MINGENDKMKDDEMIIKSPLKGREDGVISVRKKDMLLYQLMWKHQMSPDFDQTVQLSVFDSEKDSSKDDDL